MQEYFSEIKDPCREGYIKHKSEDVPTIVKCAVMCRMTELCEIPVFADSRAEFLAENFGITKIPTFAGSFFVGEKFIFLVISICNFMRFQDSIILSPTQCFLRDCTPHRVKLLCR